MEDTFLLLNDFAAVLEHMVAAIGGAVRSEVPFQHLQLSSFFPAPLYAAMVHAMPEPADYRRMSGRTRYTRTEDGGGTRTKMDLFPEYVRHLPREKRILWRTVGRALCSPQVREAFRERLAPGLEKRFGAGYRDVGLYPVPILTRDIPGYRVGIHSDARAKGMTIQLYLPRDRSIEHIGTVFHARNADRSYRRALQMPFLPNTGYAFAVGGDTHHSVDTVGPEVRTRDSILLTYFVDRTALQKARNRLRRAGNFLLNEYRSLGR